MIFIFLLLIIVTFSCSENPTEQKEEPCPPIDLVSNPSYDSPVWHPNGNFMGFNHTPLDSISYPYGKQCIGRQHFNYDSTGFWLINIDGTEMKRVLPFKLQTPAWSPDGKWIVFVLPDNQIYKMPFNIAQRSFDTTKIVQLTFQGRNFFPSWSPDGRWIAYDSNLDTPEGGYRIWKMKNDGKNKTQLIGGREPSWSLNSEWIIYIGLHNEIFKVSTINTTNLIQITQFNELNIYSTINSYPKYSPKGNLISFIQYGTNRGSNIMFMDSNGTNIRMIINEGVVDSYSWNPSGEEIVYVKYETDNWGYENGTIWIINILSSLKRQLTYNP